MQDSPTLEATKGPDEARIGKTFAGKYRIDSMVGRGGMGVVYAAQHLLLDRPVALKLLNAPLAQHPTTVQRFLAEARAAAKIRHPNVIEVFDMGEGEDGLAYLACELLEGESLAARIERTRRLAPAEVVELLGPVMDAAGAAHDLGVIHRDLKPDNIFLARLPNGTILPKLLDFGVAKLAPLSDVRMTTSDVIMGTPLYMSPEQATASKDVGPAADIWSMGVVVYEALSGRLPYEVTNQAQLFVELFTRAPTPLAERMPGLDRGIVEVVERALAREPSARYASMRDFRVALEHAVASAGPVTSARAGLELAETLAPAVHAVATPAPGTAPEHAPPGTAPEHAPPVRSQRQVTTESTRAPAPRRSPAPLILGVCAALVVVALGSFAIARFTSTATPPPAAPAPVSAAPSDDNVPTPRAAVALEPPIVAPSAAPTIPTLPTAPASHPAQPTASSRVARAERVAQTPSAAAPSPHAIDLGPNTPAARAIEAARRRADRAAARALALHPSPREVVDRPTPPRQPRDRGLRPSEDWH